MFGKITPKIDPSFLMRLKSLNEKNGDIFNVTKYGLICKNRNANIFKFKRSRSTYKLNDWGKYTYFVTLNNNIDIIKHDGYDDIQCDTLAYAMKYVGIIMEIVFEYLSPQYIIHINNKFTIFSYNYYLSNDPIDLCKWYPSIVDTLNIYYLINKDKITTRHMYINLLDYPIIPHESLYYTHPYNSFRIAEKFKESISFDQHIYSFSIHKNYIDKPFPMPDIILFFQKQHFYNDFDVARVVKYEHKQINKIVFRGSHTSYNDDIKKDIRLQAHFFGLYNKDIADIIVTKFDAPIYSISEKKMGIANFDSYKNYDILSRNTRSNNKYDFDESHSHALSLIEQSKYKYILHLDGVASAWRIISLLFLDSIIFIPESDLGDIIMNLLVENTHYVKIKGDFTDFRDKFTYCENNDTYCMSIINNVRILRQMLNIEYICNIAHNIVENQ